MECSSFRRLLFYYYFNLCLINIKNNLANSYFYISNTISRASPCGVLSKKKKSVWRDQNHTVALYASLPETGSIPSVKYFVECLLSDTRQRGSLPSAALGKVRHSVNTWQRNALGKESLCREPSSRQRFTLGKDDLTNGEHPTVTLCRVPAVRHSAKFFFNYFAECQESDTRQRISLLSVRILALGKEF
jgi:hypothetical protein